MFREADLLSMLMLTDNETVLRYEEKPDGVIPEQVQHAQGRIRWMQTDENAEDSQASGNESCSVKRWLSEAADRTPESGLSRHPGVRHA